jgi:hypothetical protein
VYFGLPANAHPNTESPFFVGNLALFGPGVRSEAHHEFKPAHFAFPIKRAVLASLKAKQGSIRVTFVPHGILVNGKPSRPKVESKVRIKNCGKT